MIFLVLLSLTKIFAFDWGNPWAETSTPSWSPSGLPTDPPTNPPTDPPIEDEVISSEETSDSNCAVYDLFQCSPLFDSTACAELEDYITYGIEMSSPVREVCYKCNPSYIKSFCATGTTTTDEVSNDEADSGLQVDDIVDDQDSWGPVEEQEDEEDNETSPFALKMLVLNLGNYIDWDDNSANSWWFRLQKIGDFIVDNGIDLLFFSEVMYDSENNIAKMTMEDMAGNIVDYIQQSLGITCKLHTDPAMYYYREANNVFLTEDYTSFWEGLASITCNEELYMLTSEVMYFDQTQGTTDLNDRIAQYTRFQYNGKDFGCVNSHWSTDANERVSNVEETLERLEEWKDISKFPNIIAGDLSVVSSADESLAVLTDAGWKDVYREKLPDSLGYTVHDTQERRQDYIWANDLFYAGVEDIELVGTREYDNSTDYWSDHYGLLLTFNVNNFAEVTDIPTGMPVTPYPTYTLRPTPHPAALSNITRDGNPLTVEDAERHLAFDFIMLFLIVVLICCLIPVVKWLWSTSSLNSTTRRTKRAAKYNQLEDPEIEQRSASASIGE